MTLQEQMVVRTMAQVFDAIDVEEMRWDEPCAVQSVAKQPLVEVEASWVDAKESALSATW